MEEQKINTARTGGMLATIAIFIGISLLPLLYKGCINSCDEFGCFGCLLPVGLFDLIALVTLSKLLIDLILVKDKVLKKQRVIAYVGLLIIMWLSWTIFTFNAVDNKWNNYHKNTGSISISPKTARKLIEFTAEPLVFDRMTSITPEVAQILASFKGSGLDFDALESVSPEVAKELVKFNGQQLTFSGFTSITPEIVKILIEFHGNDLGFVGLTSVNQELLIELVKFKGSRLSIGGLGLITPEIAKILVRFEGKNLFLGGLYPITPESAKELAKFKGEKLDLGGFSTITTESAKELVKFNGKLLVSGYEAGKEVETQYNLYKSKKTLDFLKVINTECHLKGQIISRKIDEHSNTFEITLDNGFKTKIIITSGNNIDNSYSDGGECNFIEGLENVNSFRDKGAGPTRLIYGKYSKKDGIFCEIHKDSNLNKWYYRRIDCGFTKFGTY